MNDLRRAAEMALEAMEAAIKAGDWVVDGACDPDMALVVLRQALATQDTMQDTMQVAKRKTLVELLDSTPDDAVNMSEERVHKTDKREQEPWPSVQCVCGGTIYFKYTPPISDYHEGWEEGFKAAKREWVGLTEEEVHILWMDMGARPKINGYDFAKVIESKLKERNCG